MSQFSRSTFEMLKSSEARYAFKVAIIYFLFYLIYLFISALNRDADFGAVLAFFIYLPICAVISCVLIFLLIRLLIKRLLELKRSRLWAFVYFPIFPIFSFVYFELPWETARYFVFLIIAGPFVLVVLPKSRVK